MNLVEEYKTVVERVQSIGDYLKKEDTNKEEHKTTELLFSAFGVSKESMEEELEGLKITKAWLEDTITHYVEEKGFSLEKNFKSIVGVDFDTWKEEQKLRNN